MLNLFVLCLLASQAGACGPGQRTALNFLKGNFGIEPAADAETTLQDSAFSDETPISQSDQLNCDFEFPRNCQWKAVEAAGKEETVFRRFSKSTGAWTPGVLLPGLQPALGERFLVAGSNTGLPAEATLLSSLITCQIGEGRLTFNHWLYGDARVEVLQVMQGSGLSRFIGRLNDASCNKANPQGTACSVTVPGSSTPFQLGIRALNLVNAFAVVDNVVYEGSVCGQEEAILLPDVLADEETAETESETETEEGPPTSTTESPTSVGWMEEACMKLSCDFEDGSMCGWRSVEEEGRTPVFRLFDLPFLVSPQRALGVGMGNYAGVVLFRPEQVAALVSPDLTLETAVELELTIDRSPMDADLWACKDSLPLLLSSAPNCQKLTTEVSEGTRERALLRLEPSDKKVFLVARGGRAERKAASFALDVLSLRHIDSLQPLC